MNLHSIFLVSGSAVELPEPSADLVGGHTAVAVQLHIARDSALSCEVKQLVLDSGKAAG